MLALLKTMMEPEAATWILGNDCKVIKRDALDAFAALESHKHILRSYTEW